MRPVHSIFCNT